jgi:hypothetical protein
LHCRVHFRERRLDPAYRNDYEQDGEERAQSGGGLGHRRIGTAPALQFGCLVGL